MKRNFLAAAVGAIVIEMECKKPVSRHRTNGDKKTLRENQMSKDEIAIEQEIQDKGLTAPRITPADIDAAIKAEDYHVFAGSCLTVCCITLQNGFTVTGESACASPSNFNAELGKKIARDNARNKIWPLAGYLLREQLYQAQKPPKAPDESALPPHQQRVIHEKSELDTKATALSNFIGLSPVFATLDPAEQERLKEQCEVMHQLREILAARIAAFGK